MMKGVLTRFRKRGAYGRVIVIGADGMDAALLERWLQAGELPHLAQLSKLGGWSPLRTTNPAESPVAWASFATGSNPGKHGIFDFLHRDPHTYQPRVGPLTIRGRADGAGLEAINHRRGKAIWNIASAAGRSCLLLRVPGTCPPEPIKGRMLSGLGVPDLLGTWGTSWLFTSEEQTRRRKQITYVPLDRDSVETAIIGPQGIQIPLLLRIEESTLHLQCQSQGLRLHVGEWSPWMSLRFQPPSGPVWFSIARFYLRSLHPTLSLYLSPLNVDPRQPCFPLSYPGAYVGNLVGQHGPFSTLGWPEDATGLSEGRLDEQGFLDQVNEFFERQRAMTLAALSENDYDLLISVFEATDRVQHMFWRYQDADHPLHASYGNEILRSYRRFDDLISVILPRLSPEDTLIVMSDHGFKAVRKLVHLNAWLRDHGYLTPLSRDTKSSIAPRARPTWPPAIDWGHTKAYAIGLSKIYINLRGREALGTVEKGREYHELCQKIAQELLDWRDPETGAPVVRQVYQKNRLYSGQAIEEAGDLVIGFHEGYRTSQQTAVGGLADQVLVANRRKWSADHCSIDPPLVPGVLLCNRPLDFSDPSILDLAPTVLDLLRIPIPQDIDGHSLVV